MLSTLATANSTSDTISGSSGCHSKRAEKGDTTALMKAKSGHSTLPMEFIWQSHVSRRVLLCVVSSIQASCMWHFEWRHSLIQTNGIAREDLPKLAGCQGSKTCPSSSCGLFLAWEFFKTINHNLRRARTTWLESESSILNSHLNTITNQQRRSEYRQIRNSVYFKFGSEWQTTKLYFGTIFCMHISLCHLHPS